MACSIVGVGNFASLVLSSAGAYLGKFHLTSQIPNIDQ